PTEPSVPESGVVKEPPAPSSEDGPAPATPVAARLAAASGIDISAIPGSGPRGRVTKEDVERFLAREPVSGRVRATPAARRVAREHGLDLSTVAGSGPRGRIQEADVLAAVAERREPAHAPVAAAPTPAEEVEVVRLSGLRRTIARRMQQSAQTIPAFTLS